MAIDVWRYYESKRIGDLFQATHGYAYVNLQFAAYVNDVHTYLVAFCCFLTNLKLIHLFRFDRRLSLFTETLRYAVYELLSFAMMFSIVFVAFICLFYFLFVSEAWSCSSFYQTAQLLFQLTLFMFSASQLNGSTSIIGALCLSLFTFLVVFVCLSMFLSIINKSFRHARKAIPDDQQMLAFMADKFLCWIGKIDE